MTRDGGKAAEDAILALLADREPGKTICPSEAAQAVAGPEGLRPHMSEVREAAGRLVHRGELEVTQKGRVIDLDSARGPIRLRLAQRDS
jgi:hypothetical protein